MYIYFLLFQDTGGKDNCDCKIDDDIMNFFLTILCVTCVWHLPTAVIPSPVDDQCEAEFREKG